MEMVLNEDWTADVKGRMHRCRISNPQLAAECGYSAAYLSTVLNGRKAFESEKSKEQTKGKIFEALERLEFKILQASRGAANAAPAD